MESFSLPGVPGKFSWHIAPASWRIDSNQSLIVRSGPKNDYFNDPASTSKVASAPSALMATSEPTFVLGAHVSLAGQTTFDAGLIFVRTGEDQWAKLCVELSPAGVPTIVSVVTRGVSDDCNSAVLATPNAYLRVAKTLRTFAFHYSIDGRYWHLVRYFSLGEPPQIQIGWVAQSPMGRDCEVTFSQFFYSTGELADLRDGR
ncbi:MAG: DUF1349 domain-containing protein [Pirellulales bacterium]